MLVLKFKCFPKSLCRALFLKEINIVYKWSGPSIPLKQHVQQIDGHTHLFNGQDGEVIEQVPLCTGDLFLPLVVGLAHVDTCHQISRRLLVLDVVHHRQHLVVFHGGGWVSWHCLL